MRRFLLGGLCLGLTLRAFAALVTPPVIDWVSVPSSATVGQSVSVGAGGHGEYSDNSDGNNWNAGTMPHILRITIDLQRPGQGWTNLADWINPSATPASSWTSFTPNAPGTHYIRVQLMDGRPWYSNVLTYAISVPTPAPSITSSLSASVNQGYNASYQITATSSPTSFGASNLPAGLSVNTSTGLISGRVTAGSSTVNSSISATNSVGTDTKTLTWNVTGAVIVPASSVSPSAITVGQSVTLTRNGSANFGIAWTESTIWKPDGSAQALGNMQLGSQSYTPAAGPGTYYYQVRIVDNSAYNYVDQWIGFTVNSLAQPTGFQATSVQSYSAGLSWNAVTGAATYHIYRNGTYIGSTTSTSFNVTNLAAATAYSFTVQAQDGGTNYSVHSAAINVTTARSFEVFTPLP